MSEMGTIIEYTDDISDAEAPKSLAAGDYPAEITETALGISANSGKSRVEVSFRISPEDFPADYEDAESFPEGKIVKFYVGAEGDKASRFRMRGFCTAIGAPMGASLDINDWISRKAVLTIEPDEYEGVERERARKVEAI